MSSDSEDDCYGNIAQKLQSLKSKYKEDTVQTTNLLDDSFQTEFTSNKVAKLTSSKKVVEIANHSVKKDSELVNNYSDCEEISLDTIIAQNTKKRSTRNSKRNADISADNILPTRRKKTAKGSKKAKESVAEAPGLNSSTRSVYLQPLTPAVPDNVNTTRSRGRGCRRGRGSGSTTNTSNTNVNPINTAGISVNATNVTVNTSNVTVNSTNLTVNSTNVTVNATNIAVNNPVNVPAMSSDIGSIVDSILFNYTESGRGRRRPPTSKTRCRGRMWLPDFFPLLNDVSHSQQVQSASSSSTCTSYPTYSVGNTAEYPDESYNQPLFTKQTKTDDVIILGDNEPENDSIDENEELSVKVYWQNHEHVKFTIRRFQKLTQIFDFFAKRENVSYDKLFFTYNDKILKIDDTPDSITYSIVKFIDGGIINQSVFKIIQKGRSMVKDGIKLKFQCQNVKKPFETTIRLDDKLAVAMMMCAEHLEKPLDKLKFHFDGDLLTGKSTPREFELEGGECIDVKIAN